MKQEEEIVTARITRKEAEGIAARRWMRSRLKKGIWVFAVCMVAAFVVTMIDAPFGSPQGTHHLGKYLAGGLSMSLVLLGFAPAYWLSVKSDRIGKDEAKKLII